MGAATGTSVATIARTLNIPQPELAGRMFASEPKRGDIIVFKLPSDGQTDYIKRLIGLPGDHIQVKHGVVYVNDKPIAPAPASSKAMK